MSANCDVVVTTPRDPQSTQFNPAECATLHNKLVEHIVNLKLEWWDYVQQNLFTVLHGNVYVDWSYDDGETEDPPPSPASDKQLCERLGIELTTFLERIDVICLDNGSRPFLPWVDSPSLEALFDFCNQTDDQEIPNAILLYPAASEFYLEGRAGGVFFDTWLEIAHFVRLQDLPRFPDQMSWVPLSVLLRAWLKIFEDEKVFVDRNGWLKCKSFSQAELDRTLATWNEYINKLERQIGATVGANTAQATAPTSLVNQQLLDRWREYIHDFSYDFLRQARRPKAGIVTVAPGVSIYDDRTFDLLHQHQQDLNLELNSLEEIMEAQAKSDLYKNDVYATLLFPAIGQQSRIARKWENGVDKSVEQLFGRFLIDRKAGLYQVYASANVVMVDHLGGINALQHRDGCPWEERKYAQLEDMLRTWGSLIDRGIWTVGITGITGDFSWFAEYGREIDWMQSATWISNLADSSGDEHGSDEREEMDVHQGNTGSGVIKNDWVSEYL